MESFHPLVEVDLCNKYGEIPFRQSWDVVFTKSEAAVTFDLQNPFRPSLGLFQIGWKSLRVFLRCQFISLTEAWKVQLLIVTVSNHPSDVKAVMQYHGRSHKYSLFSHFNILLLVGSWFNPSWYHWGSSTCSKAGSQSSPQSSSGWLVPEQTPCSRVCTKTCETQKHSSIIKINQV